MKLINELTDELIAISKDFNKDNDHDLMQIKIELLGRRLKTVKLNLNEAPFNDLEPFVKQSFNHYAHKRITKSIACLELLKSSDNKRKYNAIARKLVANKFYLNSVHQMMEKNKQAYAVRNKLQGLKPYEIFIESEN